MKFKIGDRVRLLSSASIDGVNKEDFGKEAIGDNLEPVINIGQQLLFQFMVETIM